MRVRWGRWGFGVVYVMYIWFSVGKAERGVELV